MLEKRFVTASHLFRKYELHFTVLFGRSPRQGREEATGSRAGGGSSSSAGVPLPGLDLSDTEQLFSLGWLLFLCSKGD